ncbi:helix-turn-helix domain-containing protein [Marixanthotalea marina]|uniref:helix-turn-helix domain-containing protein n=1 Tax=Marixanthotalea marina TaxID=2844359 RepID=UPI002989D421|nr:AraC family transcriptional regulator [Marixanthotalea marina]
MVITNLLEDQGIEVESVELGKVVVKSDSEIDELKLSKIFNEQGFELILESSEVLIEQIKTTIIQLLENDMFDSLLTHLSKKLGKNYAFLSKTFSKSEGITLEKYLINLKVEKVKEYIQLGELNFSEIAYNLNYASSSHLARQFKNITGMSMTAYKKLQQWDRKTLDQIV